MSQSARQRLIERRDTFIDLVTGIDQQYQNNKISTEDANRSFIELIHEYETEQSSVLDSLAKNEFLPVIEICFNLLGDANMPFSSSSSSAITQIRKLKEALFGGSESDREVHQSKSKSVAEEEKKHTPVVQLQQKEQTETHKAPAALSSVSKSNITTTNNSVPAASGDELLPSGPRQSPRTQSVAARHLSPSNIAQKLKHQKTLNFTRSVDDEGEAHNESANEEENSEYKDTKARRWTRQSMKNTANTDTKSKKHVQGDGNLKPQQNIAINNLVAALQSLPTMTQANVGTRHKDKRSKVKKHRSTSHVPSGDDYSSSSDSEFNSSSSSSSSDTMSSRHHHRSSSSRHHGRITDPYAITEMLVSPAFINAVKHNSALAYAEKQITRLRNEGTKGKGDHSRTIREIKFLATLFDEIIEHIPHKGVAVEMLSRRIYGLLDVVKENNWHLLSGLLPSGGTEDILTHRQFLKLRKRGMQLSSSFMFEHSRGQSSGSLGGTGNGESSSRRRNGNNGYRSRYLSNNGTGEQTSSTQGHNSNSHKKSTNAASSSSGKAASKK